MSIFEKQHTKNSEQSSNKLPNEEDLWDLDESYTPPATISSASESTRKATTTAEPHEEIKQSTAKASDIKEPQPTTKTDISTKTGGVTIIEKIALFCFAMMLLFGGALGYIWLYKKNQLSKISYTIDLPTRGSYATLTGFSTTWRSASEYSNVTNGITIVPVVNITLGKKSKSGALRFYFYDYNKNIAGDPITVSFKDGLFDNGQNTLEVAATSGFPSNNDLLAYQMEPSLTWPIIIQEAASSNVKSSDFKTLVKTNISNNSEVSGE